MSDSLPTADPTLRRPGSGTGMIWMLIFAGLAIWILKSTVSQPAANGPDLPAPQRRAADSNPAPASPSQPNRASRGDWTMEEVENTASDDEESTGLTDNDDSVSLGIPRKPPASSTAGDWSIEEVQSNTETKSAAPDKANPAGNKTKKGDWELEVE